MQSRQQGGFTLMELLVVVTIVGILAAVAVPLYTEQVAKARRAEGRTALLEGVNALERSFTVNNRYPTSLTGVYKTYSGEDAASAHYDLALTTAADRLSFTLSATPRQADPKCGVYSLDQLGQRTFNGNGTRAQCWGS